MSIITESFERLFPDKVLEKESRIKYSGKFKDFNANVRISPSTLTFNLSRTWKQVDKEIKMGLIQTLLLKIYKKKAKTQNIDLYNSFIKNLHISIPKTESHPLLEDSFNRVNNTYFFGLVEQPNLKWSTSTVRKLGSYDFHTDTIAMSAIFKEELELLDYVMYHEILHKKLKFTQSGSRTYHHTAEFKRKEKEFLNSELMEKQINALISRKRLKFALSPRQNKTFLNGVLSQLFRTR